MRFVVGGGIIKDVVIRFFHWLWDKLHKEKQPRSIKIKAVDSQIVIITIDKD